MEDIFKLMRADEEKLKLFGFKRVGERFEYQTRILDGQFLMTVQVGKDSKVTTKLVDCASGEEYVLHLVGGVGEFVGKVRTEFEAVLQKIKDSCFYKEVHSSRQAKEVINYIKQKYGDDIEYLWEKFPTDAIWRRKDNKKWYCLVMTIPKCRLGIEGDEDVEVMDVRVTPEQNEEMVDGVTFFKGYHMNKTHWMTFILDGSVTSNKIFELIDESYRLAK